MRKILFSLMTMVLVMGMAGAGAFAYFSDTETSSGNTFTAGTLDLTVTGGNLTAPPEGHAWWTPVTNQEAVFFTLTNIAPGDSGTITYIVHNVGSLDGFLDLSGITIVDTEGLNPESETGDLDEPGELSWYIWGRVLVNDTEVGSSLMAGLPGFFDTDFPLAAGVSVPVTIEWVFDRDGESPLGGDVSNIPQGDIATFSFTIELDQIAD